MLAVTFLLYGALVHHALATTYYVDATRGADTNNGRTMTLPFLTIQRCVKALSVPGDECRIREGRYHEDVAIDGKHGNEMNPFIIAGYGNERAIIDGTVLLTPSWTLHKGNIYKATISKDIWQLFVDDEMMTNARWPNALWSTKTVFDNSYWAKSALNSTRSIMTDNGVKDLSASGINATDALAILNIGSFNTYVAKVLTHSRGSNSFSYANTFGGSHFKPKLNQYFLEDKLELLDQAGEWYYEKTSKTLYLWASDGNDPSGKVVRGKTQTYAFNITNCHHVHFEDMTFFATTLQAYTETRGKYIDQLQFKSLNFSFPSYSKRMLGMVDPPKWTQILPNKGRHFKKSFRMFNCTFYGTDGAALQYDGIDVTIENNLFEYNDWSAAMHNTATGGLGTIISWGERDNFIRNTVRFNGASAGYVLKGWGDNIIELNHFEHQCWGSIQNDGSHVQLQIRSQRNASLVKNWIHDSPKLALRFDGTLTNIGRLGTMKENVAMRTSGLMVKGESHTVENNLALDKYSTTKLKFCVLCVLRFFQTSTTPLNVHTVVRRNGATSANGGRIRGTKTFYRLPGVVEYNIEGDVRAEVVDADNFDFRPRSTSSYITNNVGPYVYNAAMKEYWIPGRKLYKASTPVPPKNSKVDSTRDALMWLNAYDVTTHHLYFGNSAASLTLRETLRGKDSNVHYLRGTGLVTGMTYYWRVDAEVSPTEIYKGDLWNFDVV